MRHPVKSSAFSLVELSIVLVILGLLVGGILAGQSLIRAAELRSISGDYQRYSAAINAFRDKYFALPGDMSNATSFWGKDSAKCNSQSGTAATPGTCNGTGDGVIGYTGSANNASEVFRAWQQLALAGLLEGTFTGNSGPNGSTDYVFGENSPRSKLPSAGWMAAYIDRTALASNYFYNFDYTQWLAFGAEDDSYADDAILTSTEAWNIDTKMDDGQPDSGKVNGGGSIASCTTGALRTDRNLAYRLSVTGVRCALLFQR